MESDIQPPNCHVLIIGAGLCGLGAAISIALKGNRASVFECVPRLHEVGAGLQITPNGVRILREWGVTDALKSKAAVPETLSMIRYDGSKTLAHRSCYDKELENRYGEAIWCLHRVDLQKALAKRAEELGVRLSFGCRITSVDFTEPAIVFENGHMERGDLVVAADGLWSSTRSSFLQRPLLPKATGDLAYRIVLTADRVKHDIELHNIISSPSIRI